MTSTPPATVPQPRPRARAGAATGGAGRLGRWFFGGAAAGWLGLGAALVFAALDDTQLEHERLLRQPDAVFGLSTRNTLLLAGSYHLLVGGFLLYLREPVAKSLCLLWGCSVSVIYRLGLGWLAVGPPKAGTVYPILSLTADQAGIHPGTFGTGWRWGLVGLVLGALLQLGLARRRRKQQEAAAFLAQYRQTHPERGPVPRTG